MPPVALAIGMGAAAAAQAAGIGFATSIAISGAVYGGVQAVGLSLLVSAATAAAGGFFSDRGGGAGAGPRRGVNSPDIKGNIRQAAPPGRIIYGRARTGGAVSFLNDSEPPYLYLQIVMSSRKITGISENKIGENLVTFGGDVGEIQSVLNEPYRNGATVRLWRSVRLGENDQGVDPLLDQDFDLPDEFRQRGHACAVFRFHYGANFEEHEELWARQAIPNPTMLVHGAPTFDPRDPTMRLPDDINDPDDYADAEATWRWTNNAALIQADYLIHNYGGRVPIAKMRWDEIADSANYDDEIVGLANGEFQRRHTIDGVVTLDQKPNDVLETMLTANRGFVVANRGRVWVKSSRPSDPVFTITDRMMASGFEFRDRAPKRDLINRVRVRFTDPDQDWQEVDGPVRTDEDYREADGELLEGTIRAGFTVGVERAQRLAWQFMEDSRRGKALTCACNLRVRHLIAGDIVRVWSDIFPKINGVYRIQSTGFAEDFSTVSLSLTEYDQSVERGWKPALELPYERAELETT